MSEQLDQAVRAAAFKFLAEQTRLHGETLSRDTLSEGFRFQDRQVRLVGPAGIFKPKILPDCALSVTTVAPRRGQPRPYDDGFQPDGIVTYKYRGTDPNHHNNMWVRNAMKREVPLIYFHAVVPGKYLAAWPVYVIREDPGRLEFHLEVDAPKGASSSLDGVGGYELARRYAVRSTRQRLHQQAFRERVLRAYREHCAVCHLKRTNLLDAAHIIADADPDGEPVVSNGISLCKLHHAAFDQHLFGIRPDFRIVVPRSVLMESDGPMLKHGLQDIHDAEITVPSARDQKPNPRALESRFEVFLETNA